MPATACVIVIVAACFACTASGDIRRIDRTAIEMHNAKRSVLSRGDLRYDPRGVRFQLPGYAEYIKGQIGEKKAPEPVPPPLGAMQRAQVVRVDDVVGDLARQRRAAAAAVLEAEARLRDRTVMQGVRERAAETLAMNTREKRQRFMLDPDADDARGEDAGILAPPKPVPRSVKNAATASCASAVGSVGLAAHLNVVAGSDGHLRAAVPGGGSVFFAGSEAARGVAMLGQHNSSMLPNADSSGESALRAEVPPPQSLARSPPELSRAPPPLSSTQAVTNEHTQRPNLTWSSGQRAHQQQVADSNNGGLLWGFGGALKNGLFHVISPFGGQAEGAGRTDIPVADQRIARSMLTAARAGDSDAFGDMPNDGGEGSNGLARQVATPPNKDTGVAQISALGRSFISRLTGGIENDDMGSIRSGAAAYNQSRPQSQGSASRPLAADVGFYENFATSRPSLRRAAPSLGAGDGAALNGVTIPGSSAPADPYTSDMLSLNRFAGHASC